MNNGNGALFRNRTSTLREFDLKSQAQFHPKIAPTQYNNHFIKFIWNYKIQSLKYRIF